MSDTYNCSYKAIMGEGVYGTMRWFIFHGKPSTEILVVMCFNLFDWSCI